VRAKERTGEREKERHTRGGGCERERECVYTSAREREREREREIGREGAWGHNDPKQKTKIDGPLTIW